MIYILSGNIKTGKTNALLKWTKDREVTFGFLTPDDEKGIRYMIDAGSKECFEMQSKLEADDVIVIGKYRFLKIAFKRGNDIIKKALKNNKSGYIILDELGKLELQSKGFHESASLAIKATMCNNDLHLILIIRTTLLINIIKKYNVTKHHLITIEDLNEPSELTLKNNDKRSF